MRLISPMMETEWTKSSLEMNFRLINLDAVNRGAKIERIFLFQKEKIKFYRENTTLKIFMQSNMNTLYVDYDELNEKEPQLIEKIGAGIGGIEKDVLLRDLLCDEKFRAYISINHEEIKKYYDCYKKVKKYAVDLKSILK